MSAGCAECNGEKLAIYMALFAARTGYIMRDSSNVLCSSPVCNPNANFPQLNVNRKQAAIKQPPGFIGTSKNMLYSKRVQSTPGTYTFGSKKAITENRPNQSTNLSALGANQNFRRIETNYRMQNYISIQQNVNRRLSCFSTSDACSMPVVVPNTIFPKYCNSSCLPGGMRKMAYL